MGNQYTHAWSEQDIELLEDHVGTMSLNAIANKLGKTPIAVSRQLDKLGLGDMKIASGSVSLHELAGYLNVSDHKLKRLAVQHGLPAKRRDFRIRKSLDGKGNRRNEKRLIYYINIEEFWKWATKNRDLINWYPLEKNILTPEPEWVDQQRIRDYSSYHKEPFSWTDERNEKLLTMFYEEGLSQKDIARRLGCTYNALRKQLCRLRKKNKQKQEAV